MTFSKPQQHVLFLLGICQEAYQKTLEDKPLNISLSKGAFIELALKANLVGKQDRALYKNLEMLEKNKCVKYFNKTLELTDKGKKKFEELREELAPYLSACFTVSPESVSKFSTKARTVFKR
ncbi:MAG: hypothetical protein AABX39_03910 [Nanoarchaeota archaeon]